MSINVLLVDDHTLIRNSLKIALEQKPGIRIVGEADNGREALTLALKHQPDVILMDINMPNLNGVESTRQIKNALSNTAVVGLSMHVHHNYVFGLLQAGGSGYLPKTASLDELVLAIHTVVQGKKYLSSCISDIVIKAALEPDSGHGSFQNQLTPREREIVQLVAEGHTNYSIADILCISNKTVESHRRNIMKKLNFKSSADLVKYAIRENLVSAD
jgi:two-component system, NarL family, response regulator NreC